MDLNVRAEALVSVSKINAVSMLTVIRRERSVLDSVDSDHWDFIVTVAGVFAAMSGIMAMQLPEEELAPIVETIQISFLEWKPEARSIFEDCKSAVAGTIQRNTASGLDSDEWYPIVLGCWIIEQVLGQEPQSDKERAWAKVVGSMVMARMNGHFRDPEVL